MTYTALRFVNPDHTAIFASRDTGLDLLVEQQFHLSLFNQLASGAFGAVEDYVAPPVSSEDVRNELARRLVMPFAFGGNTFDRDPQSMQRITGAAALAGFAVAGGVPSGDLYWHGGPQPFSWITATNTVVQMDAQTCFAFGQAAAAVETSLVFAARALKETSPIPANYADDSHWP